MKLIRDRRLAQGWSQQELGNRVGWTKQHISDRETERVSKENWPKWWLWSVRATVPYPEHLRY